MDIFEILRIEHASIRGILDDLVDTSTDVQAGGDLGQDWTDLLADLKLTLVAHNRAEEATLYDALSNIPHRDELADIKTEEHHLAEELLEDLEEINPADNQWAEKLAVFRNHLESHFAEEETNVFSVAQSHIDQEQGEQLYREFEQLRDDLVESVKYHPKGRSVINPAGLDLEG